MYYFKAPDSFYHPAIYGDRMILVPDPTWARPTITVTLPSGDSVDTVNGTVTNTGTEPIQVPGVPDQSAVPPMVEVENPNCKIPADAVEITDDQYAVLLAGMSSQVIAVGSDGLPVLQDRPSPTLDEVMAVERAWRDSRIAATDYLAMPDYPLTDTERTELYTYRQALRDWPASAAFPTAGGRPQPPAWLSTIITA